MEVRYLDQEQELYFRNNGLLFLNGPSYGGKTFILNKLKKGFEGLDKNFLVNGVNVAKNEYEVVYLDDQTDFLEEFKFTKSNQFKKIIYNRVMKKIDEKSILEQINLVLDSIDLEVNQFLDSTLNEYFDEKIVMDIDIKSLDIIIDKFTDVYINQYLVTDSNIPKSVKRKSIYNLLFFLLDSFEKDVVILIDNFDLYLGVEEMLNVLNEIYSYLKIKNNVYFFLASNRNIYPYVKEKSCIYRISQKKVYQLNNLESIISRSIIYDSYKQSNLECNFITYLNNNLNLLNDYDIKKKRDYINHNLEYIIGRIMISDRVKLSQNYNDCFHENTIYYYDDFEYFLYSSIINILGLN